MKTPRSSWLNRSRRIVPPAFSQALSATNLTRRSAAEVRKPCTICSTPLNPLPEVINRVFDVLDLMVAPFTLLGLIALGAQALPKHGAEKEGNIIVVYRAGETRLGLVILIVEGVPIGEHALVQDAGNQNAPAFLPVEQNILAMLMPV